MGVSVILKNCANCKKDFDAPLGEHKRGKAIYCSVSCFRSFSRNIDIKKPCLICNELIHVTHLNREDAKYCSRKCYNISQLPIPTKLCIYCSLLIPYKTGYHRRQFCSISCSVQHRRDHKNE